MEQAGAAHASDGGSAGAAGWLPQSRAGSELPRGHRGDPEHGMPNSTFGNGLYKAFRQTIHAEHTEIYIAHIMYILIQA